MAALSSLRRLRLASFEGKPSRWEALTTLTTLCTLELDHCELAARRGSQVCWCHFMPNCCERVVRKASKPASSEPKDANQAVARQSELTAVRIGNAAAPTAHVYTFGCTHDLRTLLTLPPIVVCPFVAGTCRRRNS